MILDTELALMSPRLDRVVDTNADTALISDPSNNSSQADWQAVENMLIDWGCDPSQFDDDIVAPKKSTIARTIGYAKIISKNGSPAPIRVVPDVRGGIVFEFAHNTMKSSFHIHADGHVEMRSFFEHRLVTRLISSEQQ